MAAPLRAGDRVQRYVVQEVLGAGGMGVVYAAEDPDLRRRVALKIVHPDSTSEDAGMRLMREAQAQAQLSHPNVVPVLDVGYAGADVFVVMELVDGAPLTVWMQNRAPTDILGAFVAAGRGLAAAHAAGLVHRDFKPDNVLVGRDGRPRVTDFGLARGTAATRPDAAGFVDVRVTRTDAVVGTPLYMAPEQLAGAMGDARSDQFSFCVSLFEALYGTTPFPGDTFDDVAAAIRSGTPTPSGRSGVPKRVRQAILRGLSKDPAERWPSMDQLIAELEPKRGTKRVIVLAMAAVGAGATALVLSQSGLRKAVPEPIAYWSFESIEAGHVRDQVGTAHGRVVGGAKIDRGLAGRALTLDGVDDYLEVKSFPVLGDRFTIAGFVRVTGTLEQPDNPSVIDLWDWPNARRSLGLGASSGRYAARVSPDGDALFMREALDPTPVRMAGRSQWDFVVMTYDGRVVRLFREGTLVAEAAFDRETKPHPADYPAFIGRSHDNGTQPKSYLAGQIDELAIWDVVLSAAQIDLLGAKGNARQPIWSSGRPRS